MVEYFEKDGNKQAAWRTDPEKWYERLYGRYWNTRSTAEYISGLKITQLCADINIVVEGRKLDDDGNVLLKFNNGANGILVASQIACGEENSLKIKVYGEKEVWNGIKWNPILLVKWPVPGQIYRAGNSYLSDSAQFNSRTPRDIQKDT
jgi:hypothetical protein